jgi:hypothetical protein
VLTGVGPLGEEGGIERATASSESGNLGLVLRGAVALESEEERWERLINIGIRNV